MPAGVISKMDNGNIRAEVNRLKSRALKLDLPKLLDELFYNVENYAYWKESDPKNVPKSISDIQGESDNSLEFTYKCNRYAFAWLGDENWTANMMTLFINGSRVLEVNFNHSSGDVKWQPENILAYVEGPWVKEFKRLASEVKEHSDLQFQHWKAKENKEEIANLRESFGIKRHVNDSWLDRIRKIFLRGGPQE